MLRKNAIWLGILLLLWQLVQPVLANSAEEEKKQDQPAGKKVLMHSIVIDLQGDSKQLSNLPAIRALAGEGIRLLVPDREKISLPAPATAIQAYLYLADSIPGAQMTADAYDKIVQDTSAEILSRARASWATEKPQHMQISLDVAPQQLSRLNQQLLNLYGAIYQSGVWPETLVVINIKDNGNFLSIWKGPGLVIRSGTFLMPATIYNKGLQDWINKRGAEPPLPSLARQQAADQRLWQKELELWQQALADLSDTLAEKQKIIENNEQTINNISALQSSWQRREKELQQQLKRNAGMIIWWRTISGILIVASLILLYIEYRLLRKRYLLF